MKNTFRFVATAVLALSAVSVQAQTPAPTQSDTEVNLLKLEMQRLRSDVDAMKGHIGRLIQYLQQRDAQSIAPQIQPQIPPQARPQPGQPGAIADAANAANVKFSIAGAPTLGRADAPVTIIEFSDFECPFCQRYSKNTLPEIKREYIDSGKVRYVFLDFPLEQMHTKARKAGEAAHCAGEQGKFWEMHDVLFEQQAKLDIRNYPEFAKSLNLNSAVFDACLKAGKYNGRINSGLASGRALGINATPSFVVTKTDGGDTVSGGVIITGAQPFDRYRQVIEEALKTQ